MLGQRGLYSSRLTERWRACDTAALPEVPGFAPVWVLIRAYAEMLRLRKETWLEQDLAKPRVDVGVWAKVQAIKTISRDAPNSSHSSPPGQRSARPAECTAQTMPDLAQATRLGRHRASPIPHPVPLPDCAHSRALAPVERAAIYGVSQNERLADISPTESGRPRWTRASAPEGETRE